MWRSSKYESSKLSKAVTKSNSIASVAVGSPPAAANSLRSTIPSAESSTSMSWMISGSSNAFGELGARLGEYGTSCGFSSRCWPPSTGRLSGMGWFFGRSNETRFSLFAGKSGNLCWMGSSASPRPGGGFCLPLKRRTWLPSAAKTGPWDILRSDMGSDRLLNHSIYLSIHFLLCFSPWKLWWRAQTLQPLVRPCSWIQDEGTFLTFEYSTGSIILEGRGSDIFAERSSMETSGCIRSKKCKTDGDKEMSHSNGETILKLLQTKKRSCPPMTVQTTSPNELNSGRKYVAFSNREMQSFFKLAGTSARTRLPNMVVFRVVSRPSASDFGLCFVSK